MATTAEDIGGEVRSLDESRTSVMKARVVGGDRQAPRADERVDETESEFTHAGAVEPPYALSTLQSLLEHSNSLRQNVDSYATNIHSHGHHFEAIIDLNSDDADERIGHLMFEAQQRKAPDPAVADPNAQATTPTDEQIGEARLELAEQMARELMKVKRFFTNCTLDTSLEELRMRTCSDEEVLGNGYWEVLHSTDGEIAQFNYIPGFTMRLLPLEEKPVRVESKVRVDDITWGEITREKFFRRYVQVFEENMRTTYFKELGDPRLISAKTGLAYSPEAWAKQLLEDPSDGLATEVLHWRVHSSRSGYGIPRWVGQLLAVLGSRQVDEVNFSYFENKAVPPMVFLVSGGRVTEETINRMEDHITENIKGKANFHKVLFIEAEGAGSPMGEHSGRVRVEMKPLTQAINSDALFQKYDERNIDKVGMSFRLPRMLRGDVRDFNRATADAALEFAEEQVFAPLRNRFDWVMNHVILPRLGIRFWKYVSNAPKLTDPLEQGKMITEFTKEGVLVPAEARQEAEKVLNRELRNIDEPWTRQPMPMSLAGITPPPTPEPLEPGAVEPPEPTIDDEDVQDINLTGTDLASIVTVNEMRERSGLGPLQTVEGGNDPDGALTITEFKAKRTSLGEVEGAGVGAAAAGANGAPAQQPAEPGVAALQMAAKQHLLGEARYLLDLRSAMTKAEELEAQRAFDEAKEAEDEEDEE